MIRLRRNRRNDSIRDMLAESRIHLSHLVYPLFFMEGTSGSVALKTLPGLFRWTLGELADEVAKCRDLGVRSFALFPMLDEKHKNSEASAALEKNGLVIRAIQILKTRFPDIVLYSDVALDPFSSDGHDGIVKEGVILNDETVSILSQMAVLHAEAGADYVCPSDMMDGRVGAIRQALDDQGLQSTGILSYSAKYASSFYGPFREALQSAPKSGDKKTYQMDYRNRREAYQEVELDIQEGADIVMVKPALAYLDVIHALRQNFDVPIAAYNVSGEYAMIKFAAEAGAIDEKAAMIETLTAIHRAGANVIFTYFAKQYAELRL